VVEGGSGSERRRLLVLGAGPGQIDLLQAAQARGLHVIAVDRDPAAPGFAYAERRAIVSVEDEQAIDRLAAAEGVEGVVAPGIDFPVAIAARVAERRNLAHPLTPAVAHVVTSKVRQREQLQEAGVPHTAYRVVASAEEAEAAAAEIGLPCVVKPPDRQGQRGLSISEDRDEVGPAFERALGQARGNVVLVERLVRGRELTVNAFSLDGTFVPLTVTDRVVAEPPAFGVALAHVWPSALPPDVVRDAVELARDAAEALGIANGPSYTQILVGPDGPVVGEVAARLGGGHDAELCVAALGVDLNGLAISAALGDEIASDSLLRGDEWEGVGGACVRFLVASEGTLEAVEGVDDAESEDGIVWARAYRDPGAVIASLRRGSDRVGAVLAVGSSREEALVRGERAAGRVRFRVVDAHAPVES
jgi:biotin carboxylase